MPTDDRLKRFSDAQGSAGVYYWEWEASTGDSYWPTALNHFLGLGDSETWAFEEVASLVHQNDYVAWRRHITQALKGDCPAPINLRLYSSRDDSFHMMISQAHPIMDAEGKLIYLVGFLVSVPELEDAQDELSFTEQFNQAILVHADHFICVTDLEGRVIRFNSRCEIASGYRESEVVGKNLEEVLGDPDYVRQPEVTLTKDLESGSTVRNRSTWVSKDGQRRLIDWIRSPIMDSAGNVVAILASGHDVTLDTASQRSESKRLQQLGTIAANVAHELNNVLQSIRSSTELAMALDLHAPESERMELLKSINEACDQASNISSQVLVLSRGGPERNPVTPDHLIANSLTLIKAALPKTVQLLVNIDEDIGRVDANEGSIQQVLMNLCRNSFQALRNQEGQIHISARQDIDPRFIRFSVRDNGCGMEAHQLKHIFEPYFSTRVNDGGSGLGLSIVQGIIDEHQGWISVDSTPGVGTIVSFHLPRAHAASTKVGAAGHGESLASCRCLFVDDDVPLTRPVSRHLHQIGVDVTSVTNGRAALDMLENRQQRFDILVTDLAMPGMSGLELIKRARDLQPDLPSVLCTGYRPDINDSEFSSVKIDAVLEKPYSFRQLQETIRMLVPEPDPETEEN